MLLQTLWKRRKCWQPPFSPFLRIFLNLSKRNFSFLATLSQLSAMLFFWTSLKFCHWVKKTCFRIHLCLFWPLPKQQILDSSKLKKFAGNNFIFNENGRKLSKRVRKGRKHFGKIISPFFLTVFSKDLHCRHVKTRYFLRKGEASF